MKGQKKERIVLKMIPRELDLLKELSLRQGMTLEATIKQCIRVGQTIQVKKLNELEKKS